MHGHLSFVARHSPAAGYFRVGSEFFVRLRPASCIRGTFPLLTCLGWQCALRPASLGELQIRMSGWLYASGVKILLVQVWASGEWQMLRFEMGRPCLFLVSVAPSRRPLLDGGRTRP